MSRRRPAGLAACSVACLLLTLLLGCRRDATPPVETRPAAKATPPKPLLVDVVEHDPRYMVGISYPAEANRYPGLAVALKRYADDARADLLQAVAALGTETPRAPYDLTLSFTTVVATPQVIAIDADGSTYTGGAHGNPLVACFVWLPRRNELLTTEKLVPDPAAWTPLAAYVRRQLHDALSQRVAADHLGGAERLDVLKDGGRMIDEGTTPELDNFRQFEPVLAGDGRIAAIRFVFPPYQVGPYADGRQTVDVPADVLLPYVAATYRPLFVGG